PWENPGNPEDPPLRRKPADPHASFKYAWARTRLLFAARGQPLLHHGDLALLGADHIFGKFARPGVLAVLQRHLGHVDGAPVMRNHAAHEVHVGVAAEVDHHVRVHAVVAGTVGGSGGVARAGGSWLFAVFGEPGAHHRDFAVLRGD